MSIRRLPKHLHTDKSSAGSFVADAIKHRVAQIYSSRVPSGSTPHHKACNFNAFGWFRNGDLMDAENLLVCAMCNFLPNLRIAFLCKHLCYGLSALFSECACAHVLFLCSFAHSAGTKFFCIIKTVSRLGAKCMPRILERVFVFTFECLFNLPLCDWAYVRVCVHVCM